MTNWKFRDHASARRMKLRKHRTLILESLETRAMLTADGLQFDFGNGGGIDLFAGDAGGQLQNLLNNNGSGNVDLTNHEGLNNLLPIPANDLFSGIQGATIIGNVLADNSFGSDQDPESAPLSIVAVNGLASAVGSTLTTAEGIHIQIASNGQMTVNLASGMNHVPQGATEDYVFQYSVGDPLGGVAVGTVTITVAGTNDAPVPNRDQVTVAQNQPAQHLTATILGNDTDRDSGESALLTVASIDDSWTLGSVVLSNGVVTYSPNGHFANLAFGQTATDTVKYTVVDPHGATAIATVTITIVGENDSPSADDDFLSLLETAAGVDVTATLLYGDSDIDSGETSALRITQVNDAGTLGQVLFSAGIVTYSANGVLDHLPAGIQATDTFSYQVSDPHGATDTATVTITITGVNAPPQVTAGTLALGADASSTDITSAVLSTATDPDDGETATLFLSAIDDTSTRGTVSLVGNTLSYSPANEFDYLPHGTTATDVFTYTVVDPHGATSIGTFTLTITGVNETPTADDDQLTVSESSTDVDLTSQILAGDVDLDTGETALLTIVSISALPGVPVAFNVGVVTFSAAGAYESLAVGQTATASFAYIVQDPHGAQSQATVTVSITGENDSPLAFDDQYNVVASATLSVPSQGVLTNDTDVDSGETATLTVSASDAASLAGAVIAVAADGSFTYDPRSVAAFISLPLGETTTDVFSYVVSDPNGGSEEGNVFITVVGVNDAPVATNNQLSLSANSGATNLSATLLADDTDPDDLETAALVITGYDDTGLTGQLSLVDGGLSYDANGQFTSLPAGQTATENFTYTIADPHGLTSTATVTVTIQGVNDSPLAADNAFAVSENEPILNLTADLLGNDSDVDAGHTVQLVIASIDSTGTQGLVTLVACEVFYTADGRFDSLAAGDVTLDTFTYTIVDPLGASSTATVTVTISGSNDAPVASNDLLNLFANVGATNITSTLRSGDYDLDTGETATLSISNIDASGVQGIVSLSSGTVTYDPNGQFDMLAAGESSTEVFTYTIIDAQGAPATGTVTITLLGLNDAPFADNDSLTVNEDDGALDITALALDGDADADVGETATLVITSVNTTGTVGAVSLVGGVLSYSPNGQFETLAVGQSATDTFTYRILDIHGAGSTGTITVTIQGQNDAPIADDDTTTFDEDDAATDLTSTLMAGDSDIDDGETATLVITSVDTTGTVGSVVFNAGSVSYSPNGQFESLASGQSITDTFAYTIEDTHGISTTATITITITGANDAPNADNDTATVGEDDGATDLTSQILTGDTDADSGETATLAITAIDALGTIGGVTLSNGVLSYDPNGQFESLASSESTTNSFEYTITDAQGATSTATVTVTIHGANDAPIADADQLAFSEDDTATDVTATILTGDSDVDAGDAFVVTSVDSTGTTGIVSLVGNSVSYAASGRFDSLSTGQTATDSFTYTITDSQSATSTATVTVTIHGQNDAPVANDDMVNVSEDAPATNITTLVKSNDTDADTARVVRMVVRSGSQVSNVAQRTFEIGVMVQPTSSTIQIASNALLWGWLDDQTPLKGKETGLADDEAMRAEAAVHGDLLTTVLDVFCPPLCPEHDKEPTLILARATVAADRKGIAELSDDIFATWEEQNELP